MVDLARAKSETLTEVKASSGQCNLHHDRLILQVVHRLQQLEDWGDTVAGGQ